MTIENATYIEASTEIVWEITEDVERWPEWTPTVTAVRKLSEEPFGRGSVVRIKQPGQPESEWTVTEYIYQDRFSWKTKRMGLHMTASHKVRKRDGGTLNNLRLEASGFVALLLWPVLYFAIRKALKEENHGLKTRCESMST
jgi:uncharacterized membrane protein